MRSERRANAQASSAATHAAAAVQALVARAVANHDRAAVHARRGVGLGGEDDLRASQVQRDPATVLRLRCVAVAIGVPIRMPIGVPVRGGANRREIPELNSFRFRSGLIDGDRGGLRRIS